MTGVENVWVFIWEKVWLENRHWGITQKKACNKKYPACLTILTMMDRHLAFDTPVTVIHSVLSRCFVTSLDALIFFPSAILLPQHYYTSTKLHPRIESRWGVTFSAPIQTGPGAHPASCTKGTGTFPGVEAAGA
jgi:hypothetical protein